MRSPSPGLRSPAPDEALDAAVETALVLASSEQLIIGVSSPAGRVCGYLSSELIGRPITVLLSTTLAAPRTVSTEGPRGGTADSDTREIQVRHRDGTLRLARLRVQSLATGGRPSYLGFLTVSARNAQLPAVAAGHPFAALPSPGQLPQALSAVSHEMHNLMNAVLGMSRLGARVADSGERQTLRSYFEVVERAGVRMMDVLNELLDAANLDSGAVKPRLREQDINAVIRSVCNEHVGLCTEKSVQLRMPPENPPLYARIDEALIGRVIGNLLSNALKFAPAQGWIEIDARRIDGFVEVSVEDNGRGIAEAQRHRLFVRFGQLADAPSQGGAGLGLAISSELLAAHDGQIWIETGRSGGARFVFRVPAGSAAPAARLPSPLPTVDDARRS